MTREEIADALRGRILRGLHARAVEADDRLPSARDLRAEFGGVDHRIILDAYRQLEREGLVEIRPRGGIYVAERPAHGSVPLPSAAWLTELLAQGIAREIPLSDLSQWIRGAATTLRIRTVAIQTNADQIAGLSRELRDDYGLQVTGVDVRILGHKTDLPVDVRHARLLVSTPGCESEVRVVAERLNKKLIIVDIRPDLIGGEWRLLLRRPVYVVMADERFVESLHRFFVNTPGAENIRPVVLGRDSLDSIPDSANVYVTRGARDKLGGTAVRGRLLPATRLFSAASSRELVQFIVESNLRALATGMLTS